MEMRQGDMASGETKVLFGVNDKLGLARRKVDRLDLCPSDVFSDSFKKGLLGGKPGGQMLKAAFLPLAVMNFALRKDTITESRAFLDGSPDAADLDDVDPDADDHGLSINL